MKLYTDENIRIPVAKVKKPKIKAGDWDCVSIRIDQESYDFWCSNKGNRSNFYFRLNDEWFRVPMTVDFLDLFTRRPDLFTKKIERQ